MTIPPAVAHPAMSPWLIPDRPGAAAGVVEIESGDAVVVGVGVGVEESETEKGAELWGLGMELGMGELVAKAPCPEAINEGDGYVQYLSY
jgi:hypothetical protein